MKKTLLLSSFLFIALFISGCSSNEDLPEKKDLMNEEVNTFTITDKNYSSNGYGKVRVKGYALVKEISSCNVDGPCEENEKSTTNYVYFNILETKSNDFLSFLEYWKENTISPTDKPTVILGCLSNKKLSYENDSDSLGMTNFSLNEETTNKIINSTEDNPIILDLERLEFTSGSGAPACYSHITYINIAE